MTAPDLNSLIHTTLDDNKALDITTLDVSHLTDMTDHMIICTATSNRHAKTLADKVCRACKAAEKRPYSISGEDEAHWILIDFSDTVVHIMLEETREFYSLEKLWAFTESSREHNA